MKLAIRVDNARFQARRARNRAACPPGVPHITGEGALAIVGGGPSAAARLDELSHFNGEIWAINQTAEWLRGKGVACRFVTIDDSERAAAMCRGAALLAAQCDPAAFRNATDVRLFREPVIGPTTACACVAEAAAAGFSRVALYGCEGSYGGCTTHVYRDEAVPDLCRVDVGGAPYLTRLEYLLQAECLAECARAGGYVEDRSGGLLAALAEHGDYDVTHVARHLAKAMGVDHDAA